MTLAMAAFGQNGVLIAPSSGSPHPDAMLEIQSTSKGILIPRLSTDQRGGLASSASGLLVYDTDTQSFWYRTGSAWVELTDNLHGLQDVDHDTKVQVEESPDEDRIRFDIGGVEGMLLEETTEGATRLGIGPDPSLIIGHEAGLTSYPGWNTILGFRAGQNNTTGDRNVMIGYQAGQNNGANRDRNVFVGYEAGKNNDGASNTLIGYQAGVSNSLGYGNSFYGYESGHQNTEGYRNTFLGQYAGHNNETSYQNTFVGYNAGYHNEANLNTFLGFAAGMSNRDGLYNVGVGAFAGGSHLSNRDLGDGNVILGYEAGLFANGLEYNVLGGYRAGYNLTTGNNNVFLGQEAGQNMKTGHSNVAIGIDALRASFEDNRSVAVGDSALMKTTVGGNTAVGSKAGLENTTGSGNTFLGRNAGQRNTTGRYNTIVGSGTASFNTTGEYNVFIGVESAQSNSEGNNNTFVGNISGFRNNGGSNNVFLGFRTAEFNTEGDYNIAIGSRTMNANDEGRNNIAIGELALSRLDNETSLFNENIAIGYRAGYAVAGNDNIIIGNESGSGIMGTNNVLLGNDIDPKGSNNTFLGSGTDVNILSTVSNSTAIGYGTTLTKANTVVVGDPADGELKVGVGTSNPEARLHVNGSQDSLQLLVEGDSRFKKDVIVHDLLLVNTNTPAAGYSVSVNGNIACEEVRVQNDGDWPDYVFAKDYRLKGFDELAEYIEAHNHLPGIPSAAEVEEDGVHLGDMQKRLLEKVEEMTLYVLQLEERIRELEKK